MTTLYRRPSITGMDESLMIWPWQTPDKRAGLCICAHTVANLVEAVHLDPEQVEALRNYFIKGAGDAAR